MLHGFAVVVPLFALDFVALFEVAPVTVLLASFLFLDF